MAKIADTLVKQRRFQRLFLGLVYLSIVIGIIIVPVESRYSDALITNIFDGIWWSSQTVTSVGYGDVYPKSQTGKVLGMVLEVAGVLAFGLLVSMVTVALDESKDRYYRRRLDERLEGIEKQLARIEKQEQFVVKNQVENGENS